MVKIMGILNVTPDSFSDGGRYYSIKAALTHAQEMVLQGADIIDIGGESSRPGAQPITEEEELRRVLPVIEALRGEIAVPLSIDTYKPRVAKECLQRGVQIINDIKGLRDPRMITVAQQYHAPVIIMHLPGTPQTMQCHTAYGHVVEEVKSYLATRVQEAYMAGVQTMILDPGFGFGKTAEQNYQILENLTSFADLGYPLLIGTSRKSFWDGTKKLTTLETLLLGLEKGASILRVHDVTLAKNAVETFFKQRNIL